MKLKIIYRNYNFYLFYKNTILVNLMYKKLINIITIDM